MKFSFSNFNIGVRLGLGFGALVVLLLVLAASGLSNMSDITANLHRITDLNDKKVQLAQGMVANARDIAIAQRNIILLQDPQAIAQERERLTQFRTEYGKQFSELEALLAKHGATPEELQLLQKTVDARAPTKALNDQVIELGAQNKMQEATALLMSQAAPAVGQWIAAINDFIELEGRINQEYTDQTDAAYTAARQQMITLTIAALVLAVAAALLITRSIVRPVARAVAVADAIANNRLDNVIDVHGRDEVARLLGTLKTMQQNLVDRLEADARIAAETARVKTALDNSSVNAMIADNDGNIVYANRAVLAMLANAEADLRKDLPQFNASRVLGSNFDQFHKNPAHQRNLLGSLTRVYQTQISVGGRYFRLTANPIMDEKGQRLGSVVEWLDRTAEVLAEKEVADMVQAAGRGDFTLRMKLEDKSGFFRTLGEGMNALMQTSATGMADVARMLGSLAQGDLTQRITADYQGTFGELKENANKTAEQLKEIVQRIQEATDAINVASREIAAGNSDLSQRTEQQASSLEETASSMEELTSTVKQNADNARQANQLAKGASGIAVKGGEVVAEVVSTMQDINSSSRKIVDIIAVIDGIAFQTNILALNAAVEAARAGEQGRGFAVVAGEVRNLAQRSAAAAKEIKGLISDSVSKVDNGSRLVEQAGTTMQEIVDSVKRVTDIMSEIAAASAEQGAGIEQVNLAITQMDEVTQQNAALVEEAAAAAESLEEQALTLAQLVGVFQLGSSGSAGTPAVRAAGTGRAVSAPRQSASRAASRTIPLPPKASDEWEEF